MEEPDILDREVVALAELAIARYGERADAFASLQKLKARYQRQPRMMDTWDRIGEAIRQIFRAEPRREEAVSRFRPKPGAEREHRVAPVDRAVESLAMRYAPTRDLPPLETVREEES